jgi:hypothetical protein
MTNILLPLATLAICPGLKASLELAVAIENKGFLSPPMPGLSYTCCMVPLGTRMIPSSSPGVIAKVLIPRYSPILKLFSPSKLENEAASVLSEMAI